MKNNQIHLNSLLGLLGILFLMGGALYVGCSKKANNAAKNGATVIPYGYHEMVIGKSTIALEVADDPESRKLGLMGRKSLFKNQGMLFVFRNSMMHSFWMKNCKMDLDIAYVDVNGKILNIGLMKAPTAEQTKAGHFPRCHSAAPALYAIEMEAGWFQANGIEAGTIIDAKYLPGPSRQ